MPLVATITITSPKTPRTTGCSHAPDSEASLTGQQDRHATQPSRRALLFDGLGTTCSTVVAGLRARRVEVRRSHLSREADKRLVHGRSSYRRLVGILPAMLVPAWRIPAVIVILSVASVVVLPGVPPAPLFAGILVTWALAALLLVVLHRRERRAAPAQH